MGFIFLSCGACNAELIIVGQKLIPAVRALIFGLGPNSTFQNRTIGLYEPSEGGNRLRNPGWQPEAQIFLRSIAHSNHAFRVRVSL